ncbi:hypothetical protein EYF80_032354 [Liparis tanakae]|uniref:Uncharacterized protein n=1 Tax=Liparis tanakae TaxID=230148 RepID=A0A4Z2GV96_9TELE|nr:hypothetical protein EYF80_032354 [Liparis tanakae]
MSKKGWSQREEREKGWSQREEREKGWSQREEREKGWKYDYKSCLLTSITVRVVPLESTSSFFSLKKTGFSSPSSDAQHRVPINVKLARLDVLRMLLYGLFAPLSSRFPQINAADCSDDDAINMDSDKQPEELKRNKVIGPGGKMRKRRSNEEAVLCVSVLL